MNAALGAVFVNEQCARALRSVPGVRVWRVIADVGIHLALTEGGTPEEARVAIEWSVIRRYGTSLNIDIEPAAVSGGGDECLPCARSQRLIHRPEDVS